MESKSRMTTVINYFTFLQNTATSQMERGKNLSFPLQVIIMVPMASIVIGIAVFISLLVLLTGIVLIPLEAINYIDDYIEKQIQSFIRRVSPGVAFLIFIFSAINLGIVLVHLDEYVSLIYTVPIFIVWILMSTGIYKWFETDYLI